MAIKTMYDIIEAGYQFTNIQKFSVGENPVSLPVRLFYKEGMTIRHDGVTMLTESDYLATEIDQPLTDRFGKTVCKKLFITNSNYQSGMIEITFTGVGDFLKSTDISDIKNEIDTKFNKVGGEIEGNITVRDIMPNMVGASNGVSTRNIGSATQKFNAVYADEVFVGASSLYVNGKKVIEDISNTMEFKTSIDQGMAIKTISTTPGSGSGNLSLSSGNIIDLSGRGGINITTPAGVSNKNVTISSESPNGQVMLSSLTEIDVTAPVIDLNGAVQASSLIVEGNLTVSGTTTTINTQTLTIQDNIIELNNNQSGIPPSGLISGISVNRGDAPTYRFVFTENDDTFRIGEVGFEQAVATRQDSPTANGIAFWNNTSKRFDTIAGLTYSGGTLSANAATATNVAWTGVTGRPTSGSSTFLGNSTVRTIAHSLGRIPTFVGITPSANPGGYLGEVWYTADGTNINVYNSGSATTAFTWFAV